LAINNSLNIVFEDNFDDGSTSRWIPVNPGCGAPVPSIDNAFSVSPPDSMRVDVGINCSGYVMHAVSVQARYIAIDNWVCCPTCAGGMWVSLQIVDGAGNIMEQRLLCALVNPGFYYNNVNIRPYFDHPPGVFHEGRIEYDYNTSTAYQWSDGVFRGSNVIAGFGQVTELRCYLQTILLNVQHGWWDSIQLLTDEAIYVRRRRKIMF
jgi:hypothetical protein